MFLQYWAEHNNAFMVIAVHYFFLNNGKSLDLIVVTYQYNGKINKNEDR